MRHIPSLLTLTLTLTACGGTGLFQSPPSDMPKLNAVARQALTAGQTIDLPLSVIAPTSGAAYVVTAESPIPEVLTATVSGTTLTLRVSADAAPQGLIPVKVTVTAGTSTITVRVPVEIGTSIQQEFARFNAVRAQANLNPVTFDETASMNCWLHGRYGVENDATGHTEDLTLPFATPEGRDCASHSNLSYFSRSQYLAQNGSGLPATDTLFRVPFHAVSMLRSNQTSVGIGSYIRSSAPGSFVGLGGITSNAPYGTTPVMFPGNGATTDLSRFYGAERPDPLMSCPNYDHTQTGLPLIISVGASQDTTATDATLTEDGQPVAVCVFGSTQYVNTTGHSINYVDGPVGEQTIGRRILKDFGAVFIIPQKPLNPSKTYAIALKVNEKPVQWSFKTSATLKVQ